MPPTPLPADSLSSQSVAWQHRNGLRKYVRRFLRRHAFFNWALRAIRPKYREYGVRRDTQFVVEGFPRCANTFAYVAFKMCQSAPVRIAHHLHSLGQIRRAVRLSIPTLVLTREPKGAVLSLAIRRGVQDIDSLLEEYIEYYRGITAVRNSVVVADFREVTSDYGSIIRRVNEAFGCSFDEFEHTGANVEKAYELVDQQEKAQTGGKDTRSTHVARPTVDREQLKEKLTPLFETAKTARLLEQANDVYAELVDARSPMASESP